MTATISVGKERLQLLELNNCVLLDEGLLEGLLQGRRRHVVFTRQNRWTIAQDRLWLLSLTLEHLLKDLRSHTRGNCRLGNQWFALQTMLLQVLG